VTRSLLALAALLIAGCASTGRYGTYPHVEITWAGTYVGNRVTSQPGADGIIQHQVSNFVLLDATTRVPARQGVRFGIQLRVSGVPASGLVELRRILRYPPPGAQIPSHSAPLPYDEVELQCTAVEECMTGYGLDQPWEMIPGKWRFEIWSGDRLLAEQSFTVVPAEEAKRPSPLL